jgi:hypothetical protein
MKASDHVADAQESPLFLDESLISLYFVPVKSTLSANPNMNSPRTIGMKSPRVAAFIMAFPIIAALAGVIVSLKSVMVIDYCLSITDPVDFTICETVTGGITQYSRSCSSFFLLRDKVAHPCGRYTPAVNLVIFNNPAKTGVYSFKDVCPGTDGCDKNMDIFTTNADYTVCL